MKKVILMAAVAVMAVVSANAQKRFTKGDWIVGAQSSGIDFKNRFNDGSSATDFDLSAVGGYFLLDKLAVDAMAGIDYAKVKGADGTSAFNFGAGVRYYPVGNLFARVGYNGQSRTNVNLISYVDAKVGYDFFFNDKVFFEPAVYYEKNINKGGGENILGLSVGIGVKF